METQRKPEHKQPYEHLLDPCPHCHSETFILIKRSRIGAVIGAVMCSKVFREDPEQRTHCPKVADIPQRLLVPFLPEVNHGGK